MGVGRYIGSGMTMGWHSFTPTVEPVTVRMRTIRLPLNTRPIERPVRRRISPRTK